MGTFKLRLLGGVAVVLMVATLALAPGAFAAGSAERADGGGGGNVVGEVASGGDPAAAKQGGLPFTGLDLSFTLGGGLLLLFSGVVLSRILSHRSVAESQRPD